MPLLADYDELFGKDFPKACKDIRPFLPLSQAQLSLKGTPYRPDNVLDDDGNLGGEEESTGTGDLTPADGSNDEDPSGLGVLFRSDATPPVDELREWLREEFELSTDEHDVLWFWCDSWADKVGESSNYEEQLINQSLFLQSVRRLHSLATTLPEAGALFQAYMLLDIQDGRPMQPRDQADDDTVSRMRAIPLYKPRIDAEDQLVELLPDRDQFFPRIAFAQQIQFFVNLFKDHRFNSYVKDTIKFDTLRTEALLKSRHADTSADGIDQVRGLTSELKLTKWQLRLLAVAHRSVPQVLTDWQHNVYRRRSGDNTQDLTRYQPVAAVDNADDNPPDADTKEVLRKLFGDLSAPFEDLYGITLESTTVARSKSVDCPEQTVSCPSPSDEQPHGTAATADTRLDATPVPSTTFPTEKSNGAAQETSISNAGLSASHLRRASSARSDSTSPPDARAKVVHTPASSISGTRTAAPNSRPKAPHTPAPNTWVNPYAERSAKRACSPDQRHIKASKLSVTELQTAALERLKTEITNHTNQRHEELAIRLESLQDKIINYTNKKVRLLSLDVGKQAAQEHQKLETFVQHAMDAQTTRLESALDSFNTDMQANAERLESITDTLHAKMDSLGKFQMQQAQCLNTKVDGIANALESLRQTARHEPLPGQDGFLTPHDPAPASWDQKAYEAVLLRAGWFYVACLGHRDDGFEPDGEAFMSTMARFPDIDSKNLQVALEHVHNQGYNRPYQVE